MSVCKCMQTLCDDENNEKISFITPFTKNALFLMDKHYQLY